jgi:hypothetical protein
MRDYLSVSEASKAIASEVIETGKSSNWTAANENNLTLARDLERHLAKFNIGYTSPNTGTWTARRDGTRYFSTMKLVGLAKGKLGSLISSLNAKK